MQKKSDAKLNKGLLFILFLSTGLMVAGLSYSICQYAALGILSLYILFSDKSRILQILAYTGVFAPIFKTDPDGFAFINLILLVAAGKMVIFDKDGFSISFRQGIWISLLITVCVMSIGYMDFDDILLLTVSLIIMLCLLKKPEKIEYHNVLVLFSIAIIVSSFLGFFMENIPNLDRYVHYGSIRVVKTWDLTQRFGGLQSNPNHYTIDLSIAIAALLGYNMTTKFRKLDVVLMGTMAVFGFMSVSKSFVISALIMLLFALYFQSRYSIKKAVVSIFTISISTLVLYLFIKDTEFFTALMKRLDFDQSTTLGSFTTGRSDIWKIYFNVLKEDIKILLIGAGINVGNYRGLATHNFFIEIIYHLGIIGTFCYYKALKSTMPRIKNKSSNKVSYVVWVVFLVRTMAANFFFKEMLFLYFVLSYLAVYKCGEQATETSD